MTNQWQHINENSLLITEEYRRYGNYFKGHVLTFFQKEGVSTLKFAILEITTLLDSDAIGEIFIYSHLNDAKALEIKDKYKNIVSKVKTKFGDTGVSSYKSWYDKKSFLYLGSAPEIITPNNADELEYVWNLDGQSQTEKQNRANYATHSRKLDEEYINQYLDYYIELLKTDIGFSQYENFAVIIKPISLDYEGETIPIGNIYLHFATSISYSENDYKAFINSFINIYLKTKGGKIFKEIEYKVRQEILPQLDFEPVFTERLRDHDHFKKFREALVTKVSDLAVYEKFTCKKDKLITEFIALHNTDWNAFKSGTIKYADYSKYPIINELKSHVGKISIKRITEEDDEEMIINYLLLRMLIISLLKISDFTFQQIHSFCRKQGFAVTDEQNKKAVYKYFTDKCFLYFKEALFNVRFSDFEYTTELKEFDKQLSKLEIEFINVLKNSSSLQ